MCNAVFSYFGIYYLLYFLFLIFGVVQYHTVVDHWPKLRYSLKVIDIWA